MKPRNPWIDPRVAQVRPADARAYLERRGWKPLPAGQPHLLPFEAPDESVAVCVPTLEQGRDYAQRVTELVTDLALAEGRYAVEVLNDLLREKAPAPANGAPAGAGAAVTPP